jgi:hypothetical protein
MRLFLIFLLSIFLLAGCKSYRLIYTSDGYYEDTEYIYESLRIGDKIKVQTKDMRIIKCIVVWLENDTLQVEEKNGPTIEIPLTEVHYIRQAQPDALATVGFVLGIATIIFLASMAAWYYSY